ncbi:NAD-dependent epimerase/dehydratase family protein [Azospirillum brasilense]|uniref:NAD(P)-dependent oxidoreductase n=1 Tax=Azospirillum brasilense TaxID=192 RepID=A0A6L3AUA0_AZOBR|nr:NAD(P)-dependent oxidoreductase [Azospirillum brasilense]KAA0677115.1 NAD(P)-dependent oxidoreductase [Azospirillum brasilense]
MTAARVLITGGTGLIGPHAVAGLARRGAEVHVVGRHAPAGLPDGVAFHAGDLLDANAMARLVGGLRPTHLLHLAWVTAHGHYWRAPENLDWLAATVRLARAFAEAGGTRMVSAGTCAEYDWTDPGLATGDCGEGTTPILPHTFYGRIKDACWRSLEAYAAEADVQMAWGRVFLLFGAAEDRRRLVASIIASLWAGEPALCSAGTQIRDFLAVEDMGAAFAALTLSEACGPVNLGSGEPRSIADVALAIGRLMGRPDLIRLGALPMRADDPPRLVADVRRLRDEVGFAPSARLEERLAACIAALKP